MYYQQGVSEPSDVTVATTSFLSAPGAPRNLTVLNRTGGAISLKWLPPLDNGGSTINKYDIYYFVGGEVRQQFQMSLRDLNGSSNCFIAKVTGLTAEITYGFVVAGINEISACIDFSYYSTFTPVYAQTATVTPPETPRNLTVIVKTPGMHALQWLPSDDTGGDQFLGYTVFSDNLSIVYNGTNTAFQRGSLTPNTSYGYQITAWNSNGSSTMSALVFARTSEGLGLPSSPLNLTKLGASGGSITISWNAPVDTGGDILLAYQIFRDGTLLAQTNISGSIVTYLDEFNLYAGQQYAYYVRATNSIGAGGPSARLVVSTTAPSAPNPPKALRVNTTGGKLTACWQPAGDTGGVVLVGFDFRLYSDSELIEQLLTPAVNHTYFGIKAMATYNVSVSAVTAVNTSVPALVTVVNGNATSPATPDPPRLVSKTAQSVILELYLPVDNGGTPITELVVYQDGVQQLRVSTNVSTQVGLGNLLALHTYQFQVAAVSLARLGESNRSEPALVMTDSPTIPSAVVNVTIVRRTSLSVEIGWSASADMGGEIVSYEVSCESIVNATTVTVITTDLTAEITGLYPSTEYVARVRARNSAGDSEWSSGCPVTTDVAQRGLVVFEATNVSIYENSSAVTIRIARINGTSSQINCLVDLGEDSTAMNEIDFILPSEGDRSFVFYDGEVEKQFSIVIVDNDVYTPQPKSIQLTLNDTTDRSDRVEPSRATIWILDDGDAGVIDFEVPTMAILENINVTSIQLRRQNGSSSNVSVEVAVVDGNSSTAEPGVDFELLTPSILFSDRQTEAAVSVRMIDNSYFSYPNLFFNLSLRVGSGGASIGLHNVLQISIMDDGDKSVPGPVGTIETLNRTGGMITVGWEPPLNLGAQTLWILRYSLTIASDANKSSILTPDNSTQMVFGSLSPLTSYSIQIAAVNSIGTGTLSLPIYQSTTNFTAPGPVTSVALIKATGGLLTIKIERPADCGGADILGYAIDITPHNQSSNQVLLSSHWVSMFDVADTVLRCRQSLPYRIPLPSR